MLVEEAHKEFYNYFDQIVKEAKSKQVLVSHDVLEAHCSHDLFGRLQVV